MVALKQVVLQLLSGIKAFFGALSGFFDWMRTSTDQEAGANKLKGEQNDKRDEVRKDANAVWDEPDANRLQRTKSKGRD